VVERLRWGIAATGGIARRFAQDLAQVPDAELVAVGSRSRASAEAFGAATGAPHRHGSYEELAADPDVDAVYVATPQSRHRDDALLFLEAGKAVLCEKPFALTHPEAVEMVAAARSRGVFLMEAMWSRFLPAWVELRALVAAGAIGELRLVTASFGFQMSVDPLHRLFDLSLGGGALLDLGVYPVTLASMLLGRPQGVAALAHLGETGVDEQTGAVLSFSSGALAIVHTAIRTTTPITALIAGSDGSITIPPVFHMAGALDLSNTAGDRRIECPIKGNGLHYQAVEVGRCLRAGRVESELMPLDESIAVMETLDRIREQIGLVFPDRRASAE
jgi:predicted dehydrogenase